MTMISESRVYTHSGQLGSGLLVVPVTGLIAAVVLASAYAYIDVYSPIAGYISILFVIGFGIAQGFAVGQAGYMARCRNPAFLSVVGLVTGLVALYVSWAVFEYALMGRSDSSVKVSLITLVLSPKAVWEIAKRINEVGWYSIRSATPTGIVLWIFWGIEAVLVVGLAALVARFRIDGEVFCERCSAWCDPDKEPIRLAPPQEVQTINQVVAGDLAALQHLGTAGAEDNPHLEVEIRSCNRCDSTATWQSQLVSFEQDKKGNSQRKAKDLTGLLLLTSEERARLEALKAHKPAGAAL
jgi:hypothetical protein